MQIIISTHQGNLYNDTISYVVVHSDKDGEYACMADHIPVISVLDEGYVKLVRGDEILYVSIYYGIFEFHNNVATVLCQEAHVGKTAYSAKEHLDKIRKERLEINRKQSTDFTKMEKDLRENIKKSGAGNI